MTTNYNKSNRFIKRIGTCVLLAGVFLAGVIVGKNLQEVLQERAARELEEAYLLELEEGQREQLALEEEEKVAQVQDPVAITPEETDSHNETTTQNEIANDSYKPTFIEDYVTTKPSMSIEERLAVQSSYDETLMINAEDRAIIESSTLDFSNMKITCLGDSITEGVYDAVPYPTYLQEILGAKEVVNEGVGGSTISITEGFEPMVDRIEQIPEDTDLLIVIGGINDNFHQPYWLFGELYWEMKGAGTFCGDLQLLMRRCEWNNPDMDVIFLTPTPNAYVTTLQNSGEDILDQSRYIEAFGYIGAEEGYDVVDLYHMNYMNSHDGNIKANYMVDETHFNSLGNQLLAERVASEIIARYVE